MTHFGPFEKIVDLSQYAADSEIQISHKTSKKKGLTNVQKSIAELSHLATGATRQIIILHATCQILDLFVMSKFKGAMPPGPPLIKISLQCEQ